MTSSIIARPRPRPRRQTVPRPRDTQYYRRLPLGPPWRGAGPRPDRSWVCLQRVEELGDEGNGRVAVYVPVGEEQRSGACVEEGARKPREGIAAARCCRAHRLASASSVTAPPVGATAYAWSRGAPPTRRTIQRESVGAISITTTSRVICMAMTKRMSTVVEAAMMAIESAPPGLVAR